MKSRSCRRTLIWWLSLPENYMNGAGAWPGYMVNQDYVEGGKNYENDTPEKAAEIRTLLRDKRFRDALSIGFDRAARDRRCLGRYRRGQGHDPQPAVLALHSPRWPGSLRVGRGWCRL